MALSLRILATTAFLLPLLGPRVSAQGEQVGTVTGHITRAGDLPLDAAQVSIVGTTLGSMTDASGAYTITRVPAGPQQVRIQRIGFAPVTRPVTVVANESVTLDLLMNEAAVSLDQVVVTGTAGAARLRELGNSISQVDVSKQIGSPTNVDALLQAQAPGMTVLVS